jgi:hypothetical protein
MESDSSRNFLRLDLTRSSPQYEKLLESRAPNDLTRTLLVDFCRKLLESTQLQLVQDKFIKNIQFFFLTTVVE